VSITATETAVATADLEKVRELQTMYERSERLVNVLTGSSIDRLAGLLDRLRRD
jgi:hypothetical protein